MNTTLNILKKEIRELLTKSTILPVVILALLFGSMGSMFGDIEETATAKPTVGLINEDGGVLGVRAEARIGELADISYNGTDVDEGIVAVAESGGTALLYIPGNFTENILSGSQGTIDVYWVMAGAGIMDSISSSAVDSLLWNVNRNVSEYLIGVDSEVDPDLVLAPTVRSDTTIFQDKVMEGVSPGALSGMLSTQSFIVPFMIMMIIMMAGGTVISSMGMEKENKTLETLLTLPVKRGSIVTGKLAASAIIGLVMASIYMLGFNYYMSSFGGAGGIDLTEYDLVLSPVDYILVGISLFISLVAALALCMVMGTFASNYKSAQTLTMPVMFLAMIPMFVVIFKDFNTLPLPAQVVLFAIPFLHPMMAVRSLMFDDYALVIGGIVYVTVFAIVMIALAIWIFNTDRLLTGRIGRKEGGRRNPLRAILTGRRG